MQKFILLILIITAYSFTACSGSASMYVPAVVGDSGGLVNLSASLTEGSGEVYLATFPYTGVTTQSSASSAAYFAFKQSNISQVECDTLLKISGKNLASYVDGPSAGLTFSMIIYAAINNKIIPDNVMLTGSISKDGRVGQVGGVYEKAKAVAEKNITYFIVPPNTFYERLLLKNLEKQYNLTILEVVNAKEAMNFIFYNISINQTEFRAHKKSVPDVVPYPVLLTSNFKSVTKEMIVHETTVLEKLPAVNNISSQLKQFYTNEISNQDKILSDGYYFTAADDAFLDYVELLTLSSILTNNSDLKKRKQEIQNCLATIPKLEKTSDNLEWIIGAEVREARANNKLNGTDISSVELLEEKYIVMKELNYAHAWCTVSRSLKNQAKNTGYLINETLWKSYSEKLMKTVEKSQKDSSEHLDAAKLSFSEGKYGAAIFSALYARSTNAWNSLPIQSKTYQSVLNLSKRKPQTLWGEVYHSQAIYLLDANTSDLSIIYQLLVFSNDLDNAFQDLKSLSKQQSNNCKPPPWWAEPKLTPLIVISFLITIILLSYLLFKKYLRGFYGKADNTKRDSKIFRTSKTKGRTSTKNRHYKRF